MPPPGIILLTGVRGLRGRGGGTAIALDIAILFVLVVVNGVFSMSELAVVSARKVRLQQRADAGDAGAAAALKLADEPDRFLSTVQIGITLVGILAGAYGGASLTRPLADLLAAVPALAGAAEPVATGIVVTAITYLSLVVGELVPKQLALAHAERISMIVARPMALLSRAAGPIVDLLVASTNPLARLLGVRADAGPPVTEEEITLMLAQGTRAGVFNEAEQDMVENVFRFGDRRVSSLMTPRYAVVALDADEPLADNLHRMADSPFVYFPVYRDRTDNILGVVSARDLWARSVRGESLDLEAVLFQPLFVPESARAAQLLAEFQQVERPIALVIDEFGHVDGLITLRDLITEIVGENAPGEGDDELAVRRADGSWLVDGTLPIDDFRELVGLREEDARPTGGYQTVAGLILAALGHIPKAGERADWAGIRLEVVDMDGVRIDKVLAARTPAADG